jgi:hypothetical protein
METSHVDLQEIPVLRVRADMKGKGPSAAFNLLESKLLSKSSRTAAIAACSRSPSYQGEIENCSSQVENSCSRPIVYIALMSQ